MIVLAIDTAASLCAACVYRATTHEVLGRCVLDIGKGHAEHLMRTVQSALASAGCSFSDIDRIAVSVGPGSFTGVRVGVAAARGFALALRVSAIGITTLEAIAAEARESVGARAVLSAIDAGRGEINAAVYDRLGTPLYGPAVVTLDDAAELAQRHSAAVAGSAATSIAAAAGGGLETGSTAATADIRFYAVLAASRQVPGEPPKPIYLRQADAKPQSSLILPRREG